MLSEGLPSASPIDRKLGLDDQKQLATKKEQQQFKNIMPRRMNVTEDRDFQAQSNQDKQGIDSSTQHQSTNSSIPFNKEQLVQFYRLLNPSPAPSLSTPDLGPCSIAQFGNHSALTYLVHSKEPWIIDFGASTV
ncbi:hypothetical protein CK203_037190 [Vitis vinifera]|uniref:Uncharacterized protein n=1 Tax=Vitis vinifera TaxID=29760 RepID=A0A438HSB9_VITVI|nr:hypothetical protein CK203_037190 [Vitis vinifera]